MTARRRLVQLRELKSLQRAERDIAAFDHAEAAQRSDDARANADHAADACAAVAAGWYRGRDQGHFTPEIDRAIGASLIAAEADALARADEARRASDARMRSEEHWHLAEARHRAADVVLRDTQRDVARATEEMRLDLMTSRTLAKWRTP
jgi:hypothetical protein